MTVSHPLGAAEVAALQHRGDMLRATVRLARLVFNAGAASIFLVEPDEGSLVLEASSGQGEDTLLGWRVPAHKGIAGWAYQTGQAAIIHDVDADPRFDRGNAESTGYVPRSILATPLASDERTLGVLEVLDPDLSERAALPAIELLSELARHCCTALVLLDWSIGGLNGSLTPAQRLVASVHSLASTYGSSADGLFRSLDQVLTAASMERN